MGRNLRLAEVEETPEVFFESIDLNFSGEATEWVDSTPQYQIFTEQLEKPTLDDVKDFKTALVARFPAKFSVDRSEDTIQEDTGNLTQGRSHTIDTPVEGAPSLSPSERIILRGIIKAFIRGLHDNSLKRTIVTRPTPCSLRSAFDQAQQASTSIKQMEQYLERNGRPLRSVLAEIDQQNKTHQIDEQLKRMVLFNMEPQQVPRLSNQQTDKPIRQKSGNLIDKEQKFLMLANPNEKIENNHQPYVKLDKGQMAGPSVPRVTPPKSLSRHPSSRHRKPECRSRALEYWEQNYLKDIVFNNVSSNSAGFNDGGNVRYRDIENSNWRNRTLRTNEQNIFPQQAEKAKKGDETPVLSYDEYDSAQMTETPITSGKCMSVSIGFEEKETLASKQDFSIKESIEDSIAKLALESYLNGGNLKKRARPMDIHNILNEDERGSKVFKESNRRQRRTKKQLREIIGRQGKGPVSYKKLAEDIRVNLSLMELFQISPDLSKAFRTLSTRINERTMQKRMKTELPNQKEKLSTGVSDSEVLFGKAASPSAITNEKAFRLPVEVKTIKNGKPVRVSLPTKVAQADQGSDMVIVTIGFLEKFGLPIKSLSNKGLDGLTMNVADGTSARLTHYSQFEIGVLGVWRQVEAFVRPFSSRDSGEIHLLLGLPWLHTVCAKIWIKESIIEIGDPERGEKVVKIQGPIFMESEKHKLVLCPKIKKQVSYVDESSEESEEDDTDDEESSDEDISGLFLDEISEKNADLSKESQAQASNDAGPSLVVPGSDVENFVEETKKDNHDNKRIPTYPTERRPIVRKLSDATQEDIDNWFITTKAKLGKLTIEQTNKSSSKEGTPPFNRPKQRRWPPGKEFWLRRIINDGLKCGMYERTMQANGKLSDWNAQSQLVNKSDNPGEWDEPRLPFNYQNVVEDTPGCFVELMSGCHDYLGHPSHQMFFKLDLKHGYWAIMVHPDDRHYFAFSIPGLGQLQPTRMPQGSCSASFSFTELMYLVLGWIPPTKTTLGKESLLAANSADALPDCTFYIDHIFSGFKTFEQGYTLLAEKLLPRLDWAKLRLSFKKMELFVTETVALGVQHFAGGIVKTKAERCESIRKFPTPKSATDVRKFLGAIGITRRWVKNFAEIKQPLSRLTGKV
ncbi:hypothetical protein OnM2_049057, partial [Erysiphe neolycopersici]